jgi:hypothetical protein
MRPLLSFLAAVALATPVAAQQRITPGQSVSGRIDSGDPIYRDGTPYEAYRFTARAGARYTITMRSSDFDSYLILFEGTDLTGASTTTNDDGGGGLNAQIDHTTTRSGTWTILANTISASARGSFTLDLQEGGGSASGLKGSLATPAASGGANCQLTVRNRGDAVFMEWAVVFGISAGGRIEKIRDFSFVQENDGFRIETGGTFDLGSGMMAMAGFEKPGEAGAHFTQWWASGTDCDDMVVDHDW